MNSDDARWTLRKLGFAYAFIPQTSRGALARVVSPQYEYCCMTPVNEFPRSQATFAEAAFINKVDEGAAAFYGGCILGVAVSGKHQLYWHAGRDSLMDFARAYEKWCADEHTPYGIEYPGEPRQHESILHAIAHAFAERDVPAANVRLFCYGCIDPGNFMHSPEDRVHGTRNRIWLRYMQQRGWAGAVSSGYKLDLCALIGIQAAQIGMLVGDMRYLPSSDAFPTTRHPDPEKKDRRSLGVFIREA